MSDRPPGIDSEHPSPDEREANQAAFRIINTLRENAPGLEVNEQLFRDYLQMITSRMDVFGFRRKTHRVDSITDYEQYRFVNSGSHTNELLTFSRNNLTSSVTAELALLSDLKEGKILKRMSLEAADGDRSSAYIRLENSTYPPNHSVPELLNGYIRGEGEQPGGYTSENSALISSKETDVISFGPLGHPHRTHKELPVQEIVSNYGFIQPPQKDSIF